MSDPDISGGPAEGAGQSQSQSQSQSAPESPSPALPDSAPVGTSHGHDRHPMPAPVPHAGGRYALLRLLTLVVVGGLLYLIGMRGWLLAFAAVVISGIVSLFLLAKQRNDAAANLERNIEQRKHRHEHEDIDEDAEATEAS